MYNHSARERELFGSNSLSWHMQVELKAGMNPTLTLSNDNSITPTP
jgi:hypothetical protein